jgi:DNA (cytosine-5)-methyltransferase 1
MKAIDFFCGAGGVTCGFIQAGINVLGGIDNDIACKITYEKNNKAKFLHKDIRYLKKSSLRHEFGIFRNDDELIFIGCSPCQYYTNLKTDKSKSKEGRMLIEDFQDYVDYYRPGYIFIENVPGFEKNHKSPISKFKRFLSNKNYNFIDKVINAKYFGIPQNRRRYVLLASRMTDAMNIPKENKNNIKTVEKAIGDLKQFKPVIDGYIDKSMFQHTVAKLSYINLERIKKTPKNGGDRRYWKNIPDLQLDCYKNHSGHYDVYGRMNWKKPAPTITTKFRYTSNGRYGHPDQDRAISIREGATLQSFPLDYFFYSSNLNKIGRMIGNAVPPALAKIIGITILEINNK